jgi:peptidoglycan/xylan/chitin deacetylase (PgdA/CDA1 family)
MPVPTTPPWSRIAAALCLAALVFVVAESRGAAPTGTRTWDDRGADASEAATVPEIVRPDQVVAPTLIYHNVRPRSEAPAKVDEAYDVTPEEFEAHLRELRERGYASVTHRDLAAMLDGTLPVPEKPVLLDFDDGRASQMAYVVPLLERHGFVGTFFVFTNAIGRDGYMTWEDLRRLEEAGHEVASHTVFHPFLTKIADDAELERELAGSKRTLDEGLAQAATSLAYPFGLADERVIAAARAAGYSSARGLEHTSVHTETTRHDLGGFIVTGPLSQLRSILSSTP